jgi:hypothetical protein
MKLCGFEELPGGSEIPLLPSIEEEIRTEYVSFPVASDGLRLLESPPVRLRLPRFSLFRFPKVRLLGYRLYSVNGRHFNDWSLVAPVKATEHFHRKIQAGYPENLVIDGAGKLVPPDTTEGNPCTDCLMLCSDEPVNFGSWLSRILPKLVLTRRTQEVNRVMLYAAHSWMPGFLRSFAPSVEIVQHDPTRQYVLDNPVIPSLAAPDSYFRHEIRNALVPFIERAQAAFPTTPERIFISRRKMAITRPGRRILENETELVERLLPHGYQEFFPEDKSLWEQIATISRARFIVSVGGSNVFGCYFARNAEMIVDLEGAKTFLWGHSNLLASTLRPYSMVAGVWTERGIQRGGHRNWNIDVDCLMEGLAELGMV